MRLLIAMPHAEDGSAANWLAEPWRWPGWATAEIQRQAPAVAVEFAAGAGGHDDGWARADAAIAFRVSPAQLARARRLRWLHCPSAAVHQLLTPELVASSVLVTHGAAVHGEAVAEHGLALMLAMARGIPLAVRLQERRRWDPALVWRQPGGLTLLSETTVLILGLGHIGRPLARALHALGARVLGIRRRAEGSVPGCDEVHEMAALPRLLPQADYVVLALPVTPASRLLFGREALALMRPGARMVNLGRGELVDESALLEALRRDGLGGAALDVVGREPLPEDSPLWSDERVLITPHTAGMSDSSWRRQLLLIAENLRRFQAGEPLLEPVDKARGY